MDLMHLLVRIGADTKEAEQGIKKTQTLGQKLSKGLKTAGKVAGVAVAAATTAVVAFAKSSVDAGMKFDASMSNVAAISGATGKDLDKLRKKAKEMGSKTKFSASEAADAFSYMAMAGWKTEDMLEGIDGVMNLAAASGADLATTSDIVTDALTAFGLKASDAGHFSDILAAASSNANTNVELMGETFKYVAPVAGALGMEADDVAVAIGLMANAGIKGSQAGTALRSILTRLVKPTKESQEAMDALGISVTNSDGSMKSMDEIMATLREKFGGLTEAQQAEYAASLAGQEGMSGLLAIVNASEEDFNKLTTAVENCDGAAEKMAATMQDNLQGDLTIFKSALEGAQIALSEQLTPALRNFVKYGTTAVADLTKAFEEDGLNGAMDALGHIISDGIALILEGLPGFIDAGLQLLEALIKGILDNLPKIVQAAGDIATTIIDTVKGVNWLQLGTDIWDAIKAAFDIIGKWATDTFGLIVTEVGKIDWQKLGTDIWGLIIGAFADIAQWATDTFNSASEAIEKIDWAKLGETIWGWFSGAFSGVVDFFKNLFGDNDGGVAGEVKNIDWKSLGESIWKLIKEAFDGVVTFYKELYTDVTEKIKEIDWADVGNWIWDKIKAAFDTVVQFFKDLFSADKKDGVAYEIKSIDWLGLGKAILDLIVSAFDAIWTVFSTIFTDAYNAILEVDWAGAGQQIWDWIKEKIDGLLEDALNWGHTIFTNFKTSVQEGWDSIKEWFSNLWEEVKGIPKKLIDDALNWGKDLIGNFKKGITQKWDDLRQGVEDVANGIKGFLGFSVPEDGPLSDFDTYAPDMMDLFIQGIKDKLTELVSAITIIATTVVAQFKQMGLDASTEFKNAFGGLYSGTRLEDALKNPFTSAYEAISRINWYSLGYSIYTGVTANISSIRDAYRNAFDFSGMYVKTPHWWVDYWNEISGTYYPVMSVHWYRKAYDNPIMFNKPTVLGTAGGLKGFGDGPGGEVVLSEAKLKQLVGSGGDVTNNNQFNIYQRDGEDMETLARRIEDILTRQQNQRKAAFA